MKCKDCEKYIKTSTSEHGVCSLLKDYFPTKAEDECVWIPNKGITCKDCIRFENDFGCFTAKEEDDATNCSGYKSRLEEDLYSILFEMTILQMDVQSILENMLIRIQNDEVYKFLSKIISQ